MTRSLDAVVVGSGHNGLVAAAYLARAGWAVEVCEQGPTAGGAVATEQLTAPGYLHDPLSSWHPLFCLSATWAELGDELRARGLVYDNVTEVVAATVRGDDGAGRAGGRVSDKVTDVVAATVRGDDGAVLAFRDAERTAAGVPGPDGDAYLAELGHLGTIMPALGELLSTELHSARALAVVGGLAARLRAAGTLDLAGRAVASARSWLRGTFAGSALPDLLAPWILHNGLTPEDAGGAIVLLALAGGLHEAGMPVVRGGSAGLVDALVGLIADHGGVVRCATPVTRIVVRGGRAVGVIAGGEEIRARRAVIAGTTPTQLYGELLAPGDAPADVCARARGFRYNRRAGMMIHLALSTPPRWRADPRLGQTPVVHISDGLDAVSRACAEAADGLLPARPTIVCGQPTAVDPTRAPDGGAVVWIQLQEIPPRPRGDAGGEIDVGDGTWTPQLADAYAERVVGRLGEHVESLSSSIVGRAVLSPADLQRRNPNLVGGDLYGGALDLDQSWLWRPLRGHGSHATALAGLYQCGASTHPGPGLNAASGRIVARALLHESLGARLRRSRFPGSR